MTIMPLFGPVGVDSLKGGVRKPPLLIDLTSVAFRSFMKYVIGLCIVAVVAVVSIGLFSVLTLVLPPALAVPILGVLMFYAGCVGCVCSV